VGSTRLSQHLDPEQVHSVLDSALARCTRIVESHGGRVLQYAGDSILAAHPFEWKFTREDLNALIARMRARYSQSQHLKMAA
jgi:class 3 adenylate cyclase